MICAVLPHPTRDPLAIRQPPHIVTGIGIALITFVGFALLVLDHDYVERLTQPDAANALKRPRSLAKGDDLLFKFVLSKQGKGQKEDQKGNYSVCKKRSMQFESDCLKAKLNLLRKQPSIV